MSAEAIQKQFGIDNALRFEDAPGGLVRAVISTPHAEGDLYTQGAHVAHWTPGGLRPVLFTSSKSLFAPGKAIRGGVPIIWPWFGGRGGGLPGPAHGFARSTDWKIESTKLRPDGAVEIALVLTPNEASTALGYGAFKLRFRASFGKTFEMELETRNDGKEPLKYEDALHTYFAVGDISQTGVTGLEGTTFIDKTDGFKRKQHGAEPVKVAKETDQVHLNTQATCVIHDAAGGRKIVVEKSGSDSTVVWNPWTEKIKGMSDMAPDEWREFICVESCNAADHAVTLAPGQSRTLRCAIRVE